MLGIGSGRPGRVRGLSLATQSQNSAALTRSWTRRICANGSVPIVLLPFPADILLSRTSPLGAGWEHECTILRDDVDPLDEAGSVPTEIVPVFGWGATPDQYGRVTPGSDEESR